ncbi:MAG TPA: hypothetical protein VFU45_06820, partial [Gemmatimonadales bacterium]|nr:hypothetical protein [Gemmatimonadales bacterium]
MSSRALLCAGVLALGAPAAARAQSVAQLQAIRIRLQREADSLQAVRRAGPSVDTVRLAGGWTLLVSGAARPFAEREVPVALAEAGREFGGALSPSAGPIRVVFDSLARPVLEVSFTGAGPGAFAGSDRLVGGAIGELVRSAARKAVWAEADATLRAWAGGQALESPYATIAPAARIRLARDTGSVVTGCRHGDVAACERALSVSGGVSEVVRTSLFRYVLERAGGTDRLPDLYAEPTRPVLDRLAALAGEPREVMVSDWRERLIGLGALTTPAALVAALGALMITGLGIWGV